MTVKVTWVDTNSKFDKPLSKFQSKNKKPRKRWENNRSKGKNTFSTKETEKILRCIGFDVDSRKWYIDREFKGVMFRLYSIYKNNVIDYVKKKITAKNLGFLK